MKHNKKVNPLTHFNNLKADAIKKASGEMDNYKKSLIKAQAGYMVKFKKNEPTIGPLTETQATVAKMKESMNDPMSDGRGPRITTPKEDISNSVQKKGGAVKRKRK